MESGKIFLHPILNEYCIVSRVYSNRNWYFIKAKDKDKNIKEIKSTIRISDIDFDMSELNINTGDKVKINIDEINKSKLDFTDKYKNFIKENEDKIFIVEENKGAIVHLKESIFTFWVGFLIKMID